ncbi:class I SAM-dependent methyltransferase [Phyllobacterium endophyticum]|uniref:Class I SAM-dependent methyltransferase n=1 Tax=Phyllobacterium endophyticum TaxID=1149773 RepID=A0A2P7ARE0_9HYPH|nr:class I SAM-dependent methyltransferase [Phyllobacterium endophyticum]MBB3237381.1 2-polyprenyl-3-methyl-5-hydroxy-6-metoxy-1,4-benzoquinol methylase [Phyllobacterium endophyticum]PSH56727.1 class I SAM-dependent methyltransferase [Phyllobacterium endophyticum]TYR44289.1 class I SAM-dependent methyltransferase [Phyllobacterium endophyticum]
MTDPISLQQDFWNRWNSSTREKHIDEISFRQAEVVRNWLATTPFPRQILEVGCGAGWFCRELSTFGELTATDLSDEVLVRAAERLPQVEFVAGDFMQLDFGRKFDVIVTLEVLSHVANQQAFVTKLASHLREGGQLMLATQNKPVLQKYNRVPPPSRGQLRRWVDKKELTLLLSKDFDVVELFSVTPRANKGILQFLHSRTFNRPIRALIGKRLDAFKESIGLGWTLMARARKKAVTMGRAC